MVNTVIQIIKIARPIHWIKNFAVFAALIFTGTLFIPVYFNSALVAFLAFCFISSASYIINDIQDAKLDRLHPVKKNRPVASGKLSVPSAYLEAAVLIGLSYHLATKLNPLFMVSLLAYLVLQILYSTFLKNVSVLDILIIATGFVIRVYAGAFAINAHLSVWFLLCVVSVALFLAAGKRRSELSSIEETKELTRKSLTQYRKELLNSYVTMFGNAAWMSWSLFTFFESPRTSPPLWLFLAEISKTTTISKLLMITIPVVIFIIMRYEKIIFENESEAPEKAVLSDSWLMSAVALWTFLVISILYGGTATSIR